MTQEVEYVAGISCGAVGRCGQAEGWYADALQCEGCMELLEQKRCRQFMGEKT